MRHALASLIAIAAVSSPAFAQDEGVTTVETTTTVTTTTTEVPAAAVTTTVTAPSVDVAPPAPALPPVPNDPNTLQVLGALDRVCKPVIAGADVVATTKPLGFKKKREVYVLALAKPSSISLTRSASNPNVCNLEVIHPVGGDKDITVGLHNWAISQGFTLYRNDEYTTDLKRHTRSWERTADGKTEALVLVTEHKPDGSGTVKNATRSTVMYSIH